MRSTEDYLMPKDGHEQLPALDEVHDKIKALKGEVHKRIIGMDAELNLVLICLFAGGHVLLEGVPGLAKTLLFKTLAQAADVEFRRISFAADLLPKDVIGIEHFDFQTRQLELVVKGPLHTNFLLTDELNRARTSSKGSILEPMEEGQVTTELGGTYKLKDLFMVVATQNPVEEEGTFGLGRAEKDRFLMLIPLDYPSVHDEIGVLNRFVVGTELEHVQAVISEREILAARESVRSQVHLDESIISKVQQILNETRPERSSVDQVNRLIQRGGGASPRAGIAILQAARVHAVLQGSDFVQPDDVAAVTLPTLRHRLVFRPGEIEEEEAERHLRNLVDEVINKVL